ncbi:MAG: hypothetical protein IKM79_07300 [Bacteroidales bacterium]|nr:hypothetical protein [Bacteroidales bacterium]
MKNISTQNRNCHVSLFLIFTLSMLVLTSCGRIKRQIEGVATYPTTAEEVADMAKNYHSDAALVVTKADTQYVLYRDRDHDGCYAMRYVSKHRCRHDFSARGNKFSLGNPEQTVVLKRTGDNALTLTIDSLTIAVSNIIATDSALNFRFGFDKADRNAVLYLYDKAIKEPMAETSIQQMLFLALSLDSLVADAEEEMAEAEHELELAELELELVDDELESAAQQQAFSERYAVYSKLDSLASVLGFANKEAKANDEHMVFKAWGGLGGSTNCYERMERMAAVANGHVAYSVHHKPKHRGCTFTARW